jgi:hypothetical protein
MHTVDLDHRDLLLGQKVWDQAVRLVSPWVPVFQDARRRDGTGRVVLQQGKPVGKPLADVDYRFTSLEDAKKMCPGLVAAHVATYRNGEAEAGYWEDADPLTHKVSHVPSSPTPSVDHRNGLTHEYRSAWTRIGENHSRSSPSSKMWSPKEKSVCPLVCSVRRARNIPTAAQLADECFTEKASIDEAFIDLTPMTIERLLQIHPHLAAVPSDAPDGLDSPLPPPPPIDWSRAGNLFPVNGEPKESKEALEALAEGGDESDGLHEGHLAEDREDNVTWGDWALCIGAEIMGEVRAEVWKKLHYTCSAVSRLAVLRYVRQVVLTRYRRVSLITRPWLRCVENYNACCSCVRPILTATAMLGVEETERPDYNASIGFSCFSARYDFHRRMSPISPRAIH